jgi:FkbM family methyltransferase
MTRALLVSPTSVPGGAERAFASLAHRLPELGVDVRAVVLEPGPLEGWLAKVGCSVDVIDAGRTRDIARTAAVVAGLAARARAADVVLSNQSKGHVYGGLAAYAARRPALWWQHGYPTRSRIEMVAARVPANAVLASSAAAIDAQRRLTPTRRIERVRPGIDVSEVRGYLGTGASLRTDHGWGDPPLVGIVGRLQEGKGQDVFLRAAARVAAVHDDARFVVVGGAVLGWEGDFPQRLHDLAARLGISDRVEFVGHQADVYPWFDALDVVVHASKCEPFGLVVVEAMALGKPLVATGACGPAEIIEDGLSGLLVPPEDDRAMALAVARILDDDGFAAALAEGATRRAEDFDEIAMARRVADVIAELTRGAPASAGPPLPQPQDAERSSVDSRRGRPPTLPRWLDTLLRRALQVVIRYVPPRGRGVRLAHTVERLVPADPGRLHHTHVVGGAGISLNVADRLQACIFYTGSYEPEVTDILLAELRDGDTFLDVGANAGYFSLVASGQCGPRGVVHAFEADPALAAQLSRDAARLGRDFAPVVVHDVAVLDRPGRVCLVEPPGARGELGERYVEPDDSRTDAGIRATSIDELLPDLRFDVAKIDVEGAEVSVVQGASAAIRRSSPRLLLIEAIDSNLARFGSSVEQLTTEMAALGFGATTVESRYFAPMLAFRPHRREP